MKSQKGITLVSVAIYVILVFVVLGVLATVTMNFKNGIKDDSSKGTEIAEINKFNMYFLQEVKKQGNEIKQILDNEVLFVMGNKYTFKNDGNIYLNDNIKIAENIEKCLFSYNFINGKKSITVTIKTKNSEEQIIEYVFNDNEIVHDYIDENEYIK